jgi:hypothetical protein
MTESSPATDTDFGREGQFQTGRVTSIAAGHAVHDTYTAFLAPLLPSFVEKFSLTNAAAQPSGGSLFSARVSRQRR